MSPRALQIFFLCGLTILGIAQGVAVAAENAESAVRGLIERLIPAHANQINLAIVPKDPRGDVFELETVGGKLVLRGNNGVAMAAGLNWYLKYFCQCHVSQKARQLRLPEVLPQVPEKVRRVSQDQWRYFLNYCCFGYSLPWYDWEDWEHLIDWMALNGINAPLSVTGQEAVWEATGRRLGFTGAEMREFLAGPPYLPFSWMGCLDSYGGPLPASWVQRHADLQKKILARERAFGMTPVLQGFTGHVPGATKTRFANARLHQIQWAEWKTYMLDPLDPLFARFSSTFLEEQAKLFGTDHLYAADTFIEMTPPSGDTNFLAAIGKAIYAGMTKTDPEAVWVLQGWTFFNQAQFWTQPRIAAFLNAVPNSGMLVLDLFCDATSVWDKTSGFYGKPWVWCSIQTFGDCVYLGGALNRMHSDLPAARRHELGKQLSGVGFVNEGLDYNPVVFDYVFEQAWRPESVDLNNWVRNYSARTHGTKDTNSAAAWAIFKDTVFTGLHQFSPAYLRTPSTSVAHDPPYSNERLTQAWRHLLLAADSAGHSDAYRYDLVSVSRQVLANYSAEVQREIASAWSARDRKALQGAFKRMLELLRDVDSLLATRPEYLLGRSLAAARRWGDTPEEKNRMEWNARRVTTMWGDTTAIRDYARREWSGMLTGYYARRWEKFGQALDQALATEARFDAKAFDRELQKWERGWADAHEKYPTDTRGDAIAISRQLFAKYEPELKKAFAPEVVSLTTGKPSTASSSLPNFPASLANDGRAKSTDSYWATDINQDKDPWWQVDFEKVTPVGRVVMVGFFGDKRFYGFKLEGSKDGQVWEILADQTANKELSTAQGYTCRFTPRELRYLRVRQTHNSANSGRHLVEVLAFEK